MGVSSLYLTEGSRGLFTQINGKFYFPDRKFEGAHVGIVENVVITKELANKKCGFITGTMVESVEPMDIIHYSSPDVIAIANLLDSTVLMGGACKNISVYIPEDSQLVTMVRIDIDYDTTTYFYKTNGEVKICYRATRWQELADHIVDTIFFTRSTARPECKGLANFIMTHFIADSTRELTEDEITEFMVREVFTEHVSLEIVNNRIVVVKSMMFNPKAYFFSKLAEEDSGISSARVIEDREFIKSIVPDKNFGGGCERPGVREITYKEAKAYREKYGITMYDRADCNDFMIDRIITAFGSEHKGFWMIRNEEFRAWMTRDESIMKNIEETKEELKRCAKRYGKLGVRSINDLKKFSIAYAASAMRG